MVFVLIIALVIAFSVILNYRKQADSKSNIMPPRTQSNSDFKPNVSRTSIASIPQPITCDVKGTLYRTPDEISAARMCEVGDHLILERDPYNEVDRYAVKVMTLEGFHIGYVGAEYSEKVASNIDHIYKCVITRVTKHEIPFISINIDFTYKKVQQPAFIPKAYQCSPEDKMRNLSTTLFDDYEYRQVSLLVQDLYERDRDVIAKARACRKGDKVILKKGVCDELYPDRIDIYLADGTYLGYAAPFGRKEVFALFDKIIATFVGSSITPNNGNNICISVIFPDSEKCPSDCLPTSGIGYYYSGNYQEVKLASDMRRTNPFAALDILLPIVKKEKGIDAHLECIACYFQLKEWESRIDIIQKTLAKIETFTEEDYPSSELVIMHRHIEKLRKQLDFSQKRLEGQYKKRKKSIF